MASVQTPSKIAEKFGSKDVFLAVGMMSGTSMDGIDVALIRSDGKDLVEKLASAEYPYEAAFRDRLAQCLEVARSISTDRILPKALAGLETEITRRHGEAVRRFLADLELDADAVDLVGFHGQTVLHRPHEGFTVQLGDGQLLANDTGIACVYDMRSNDMAHGGQGAPLVPIFHQALATGIDDGNGSRLPVAFVNIGGISNISYVGKSGDLIAFDTGPGNALIDQWVQSEAGISYDQGGAIASEGGVIVRIAERYLAGPFFEQAIPKSLDRNDFKPLQRGEATLEDGARTLAHVSAAAIIKACDHLPEPPKLWVVCGGGRKNAAIMADLIRLACEKNGADVILAEEAGLDGDSMEAEAWAYLAIRAVRELPLTFPMTTGCKKPVSGGRLVFPQE